jgi:hypothetical protein
VVPQPDFPQLKRSKQMRSVFRQNVHRFRGPFLKSNHSVGWLARRIRAMLEGTKNLHEQPQLFDNTRRLRSIRLQLLRACGR